MTGHRNGEDPETQGETGEGTGQSEFHNRPVFQPAFATQPKVMQYRKAQEGDHGGQHPDGIGKVWAQHHTPCFTQLLQATPVR